MATTFESTTTHPKSVPERSIQYDLATCDYALYLGGQLVGHACYHHSKRILDLFATEILIQRAALCETLDELAHAAGNPALFSLARSWVEAGISIVADGPAFRIGPMQVQFNPARVGWPWCCQCGMPHCWHAAVCEAAQLTAERQSDDVEPFSGLG